MRRDGRPHHARCRTRTCRISSTAIRTDKEPNCPFDLGYRVSIACRMAVESYRQGRTVRWDAARRNRLTAGCRNHPAMDFGFTDEQKQLRKTDSRVLPRRRSSRT